VNDNGQTKKICFTNARPVRDEEAALATVLKWVVENGSKPEKPKSKAQTQLRREQKNKSKWKRKAMAKNTQEGRPKLEKRKRKRVTGASSDYSPPSPTKSEHNFHSFPSPHAYYGPPPVGYSSQMPQHHPSFPVPPVPSGPYVYFAIPISQLAQQPPPWQQPGTTVTVNNYNNYPTSEPESKKQRRRQ